MADQIETREESNALQAASDAFDRYADSDDRSVFRAGWLAGREWARRQESEATRLMLAQQGARLLGCPHTVGCATVEQCAALPVQP